MTGKTATHEEILESFNRTVTDAAAYLGCVDEKRTDGHQSAHGVLAQMVFWHEQYVQILGAIAAGQPPTLLSGPFDMLNMIGRQKYAREAQPMLAHELTVLHHEFDRVLRGIADWSLNFPVKQDSGYCSIAERVRLIDAHIHNRVALLKRSEAGLTPAKTPLTGESDA